MQSNTVIIYVNDSVRRFTNKVLHGDDLINWKTM